MHALAVSLTLLMPSSSSTISAISCMKGMGSIHPHRERAPIEDSMFMERIRSTMASATKEEAPKSHHQPSHRDLPVIRYCVFNELSATGPYNASSVVEGFRASSRSANQTTSSNNGIVRWQVQLHWQLTKVVRLHVVRMVSPEFNPPARGLWRKKRDASQASCKFPCPATHLRFEAADHSASGVLRGI